jgi:hypothetical protein
MTSRRQRTIRTSLAVAAALVAVTTAAGCGAVERAFDCAQTALVISDSVDDLQRAVSDAGENPAAAQQALDEIDKNLDDLGGRTDNADVAKAVDQLADGVNNVRDAIESGQTPDLTPVTDAAGELTNVCSPG